MLIIGIQLFTIVLFFLLGWAIKFKNNYWLVSGFANRSKEEQQQLINNGLPQKTGTLLIATAAGMLILLPLAFTPFRYTMEVQFGFMLVFLMGGIIYLSKYEVPQKRKKSYIISSLLFIFVIGLVGVLTFLGYQNYELVVKETTFEITGIYGDEWEIDDITNVVLMAEMPEVTWKQNGFGLPTMSKGYFTVKDYGSSLLFVKKNFSPYIYIKVNNKNIFINGRTSEQTHTWFEQLNMKRK
ncbi:DUF3784 domain-containing protein [Desulfolucanica intricata]|uniref:DUF3784 domain-containing protein n=1 Tax=Desulfolucanica intricata TaxID=1285191 RepID=UPI00082B09F8|nr:DUF3784 domain-containing protein [Desulfolucanica intricata]